MKISGSTRIYTTSRIAKNQTLTLRDERFHYCKTVLRMKLAEEFRIFQQDDGEFKAKIIEINRHDLKIILGNKLRDPAAEKPLILAICIIKPDRFAEAVKGGVQLGVTHVIPIISARTQFRTINDARITRCIVEASEQSGRFAPPALHQPIRLDEFCNMSIAEQIIFANEGERADLKINSIGDFRNNIAVLVGPEGGFTEEEKEQLRQNPKIVSISLGRNVLRSEVAAISILASVNLLRD